MANSLEFAKKFLPVLDDIYKYSSITQGMDAGKKVDFTGTNEVNVLKTHTTGLGDYSRTNGYPKGDITANWEILKLKEVPCIYVEDLTQEQQKAFRLVDNKTAEFSQWDIEKLEQELSSIFNIDMETFHFPDFSEEELGITDEDFLQESEISQSKKEKTVICPHCGKEFTV